MSSPLDSITPPPRHSRPSSRSNKPVTNGTSSSTSHHPRNRLLIDVRTPPEFLSSQPPALPGALNIEHPAIELLAADTPPLVSPLPDGVSAPVDRDAEIVLYCRSGRRSGLARETLERLGYRRVRDWGSLESAWERWREEEEEEERQRQRQEEGDEDGERRRASSDVNCNGLVDPRKKEKKKGRSIEVSPVRAGDEGKRRESLGRLLEGLRAVREGEPKERAKRSVGGGGGGANGDAQGLFQGI